MAFPVLQTFLFIFFIDKHKKYTVKGITVML